MTAPARDRLRPWLGSLGLHVLLVVVLAAAAINWRTTPPAPQLAIEGSVVRYEDLPPSVRAGKPLREPRPAAAQPAESVPAPEPQRRPEPTPPEPAPAPDPALEQQRAAEQAAQQQRKAEQQAAAERARAEAAERKAQAERAAAAQRKADEARKAEEAARQADEARKAEEARVAKEQAARQKAEAKQRAEREAQLQRALAQEEEGEAFARSGVVDEYRALLVQTIERNWNRPPSVRPGLECTLYVTQATGGTVLDVKLGACNGDPAVRDSVVNAVYRSSPLPAPRDPRAFQRQLVIVFKPTE